MSDKHAVTTVTVDMTPATREDVDAQGYFLSDAWPLPQVQTKPSVIVPKRMDVVLRQLGLRTVPGGVVAISHVSGCKVGGRKRSIFDTLECEASTIPAVAWFDYTTMLRKPGSNQPVLATQPYALTPAMVDDLARQIAPFGLQVYVFRYAAWRHPASKLVLIAQPGVLDPAWAWQAI